MTSKLQNNFLMFVVTLWGVGAVVGCSTSTFVPIPTELATETAISTKTTFPSPTSTLTPEPSPIPYNRPNLVFYVRDDHKLFSVSADGGNQREIAQGLNFSISPDKKKLVYRTAETYGSNTDEVVIMDLEREKIVLRWNIPGYCEGFFMSSYFTWSPNSQKIAFTVTRYDLADPDPDCKLKYNYQDMGIYQIDLMSRKTIHPPLIDAFISSRNSHDTKLSYSPDGSKLRLGPGWAFDAETWEKIDAEPFHVLLPLCDQPEKIGICNESNLCLYNQNNQISKHLTEYRESWEGIETFKIFSNCSVVVYQTQEHQLHLLSLSRESDEKIGTNVWEYLITPNNDKIVLYERDKFGKEANILVVNNDGSNKYNIANFPARHAAISGPLMVLSPTGEKVAFVNRDGIAIMDLDGNDFIQLVNLPDGAPTDSISLEILDWH